MANVTVHMAELKVEPTRDATGLLPVAESDTRLDAHTLPATAASDRYRFERGAKATLESMDPRHGGAESGGYLAVLDANGNIKSVSTASRYSGESADVAPTPQPVPAPALTDTPVPVTTATAPQLQPDREIGDACNEFATENRSLDTDIANAELRTSSGKFCEEQRQASWDQFDQIAKSFIEERFSGRRMSEEVKDEMAEIMRAEWVSQVRNNDPSAEFLPPSPGATELDGYLDRGLQNTVTDIEDYNRDLVSAGRSPVTVSVSADPIQIIRAYIRADRRFQRLPSE